MSEQQRLVPGTLWPQAVAATARARAGGALQPIVTTQTIVEDQGIPFLVRVLAGRAGRAAIEPHLPMVERYLSEPANTSIQGRFFAS